MMSHGHLQAKLVERQSLQEGGFCFKTLLSLKEVAAGGSCSKSRTNCQTGDATIQWCATTENLTALVLAVRGKPGISKTGKRVRE